MAARVALRPQCLFGSSTGASRPVGPARVVPFPTPSRPAAPGAQSALKPGLNDNAARFVARRRVRAASSGSLAAGGGGDFIGKGGSGDDSGRGGGGGGGGGGGESAGAGGGKPNPAVLALLAAAGKSVSSLPADLAAAVNSGKITTEIIQRYLDLEKKLVIGWLMGLSSGFRERFLADPSFLVKLGIEVGIGVCTKMTAEYTKRGEGFSKELDFVAANVLMAIIADFMLVWLPAPTFALSAPRQAAKFDVLGRFFAGCPDNAFQMVQPGMQPFTLGQRLKAPLRNGMKLFCVGVGASFIGVIVTNALIGLRTLLDPTFKPLNQPQDVLATSCAYGTYMATSSNLRYQIVAGVIEERGIEKIFQGNHALCAALSFIIRTGNTFLGSLLWVDFVRLLGMQKAKSD